MDFIREKLNYLIKTKEYGFGILMENGNLNYLDELEIDERGYLTCYLRHVDDCYYVSKEITCYPNENSSKWMDYLYYKDEYGVKTLFRNYIVDKYI